MAGFQFGVPGQPFKFDYGPDPFYGETTFNQAAGFDVAWQQVMNQLGLSNPSSSTYKLFKQFAPIAQSQYKVAAARDKTLQLGDWLNSYVPGLGQQFGLLSAQDRGEQPNFVGRPRFLG